MLKLKFVASIAERDIDLLILEELSVSSEFQEWFSSRVFGEPTFQSKIGAWHSVYDTRFGESDIVFLFEAIDGPRTTILIENKIDALPQPDQSNRYRLRGEKGLKEGYWEKFKTCVIAPSKYLSSSKNPKSYDIEISYEELLAYFQSRSPRDSRFAYKAKVILEGIEQNRRGYQPEYNPKITQFVSEYYDFASIEYKHLGMQEAKPRPAGSTWIMFYPIELPKGINLVHQLDKGLIKLFFNGQAPFLDTIQETFHSKLPEQASIDLAGKSVAISMEIAKIDPIKISFKAQKEKVSEALDKLAILKELAIQNNVTLQNI